MGDYIEERKKINLMEYSPEILNFFNINKYKKTKEGLYSALVDWLDSEFYQAIDPKQKMEFVENHFPKIIYNENNIKNN